MEKRKLLGEIKEIADHKKNGINRQIYLHSEKKTLRRKASMKVFKSTSYFCNYVLKSTPCGVFPFPNKSLFLHVCSTSLLKTLGKEEIAHKEQFRLFPQCFLPVWRTFCQLHQIQNCHLQTLLVWKSLKFVCWERVNF